MKGKKRKILALGIVLISVALSVFGFFVLPSRVTVNISFSGQAEYQSKILVLAIPLIISVATSTIYSKYDSILNKEINPDDIKTGMKYLFFSIVGILLTLWAIINNVF